MRVLLVDNLPGLGIDQHGRFGINNRRGCRMTSWSHATDTKEGQ